MRRTVYGCKGEAIPGTGTFVGPAGCANRTSSFELSDSSGMSRARREICTRCGLEVHKSLRKGLPGRSESPLSIESSGFVGIPLQAMDAVPARHLTVQYCTVSRIGFHAILTHGVIRSQTYVPQCPSLPQESDFKKPCFRCEIVSRLGRSGEKGRQVSKKRNGLRTGRSRQDGHVHSRRWCEAYGGQ